MALPSTDEPVWRYSRVDELDLARFAPVAVASTTLEGAGLEGDQAAKITLVDGHLVELVMSETARAAGLTIRSLASSDDAADASVLAAVHGGNVDVFSALNGAHAHDPVLISVRAGGSVPGPVVVVDWVTAAGALVAPRLVVQAAADAELTVVHWQGSDDVEALVTSVVDLDLDRASRVRFCSVQDRGASVWQVATISARVMNDANVEISQVGLGGEYARARVNCDLVGRGSSGTLNAAYFGTGHQTLDFRTFQDHIAPDTTSNLLFKGVVDDASRSIYTGNIRIEPDARRSNAFQTNRNLKLSEQAWAESVPNLEIENNDVHCSHASTVGPVDEEQRFYLESRGVPPDVGERLIVAGFFQEVLATLPDQGVIDRVTDAIARRLVPEPVAS